MFNQTLAWRSFSRLAKCRWLRIALITQVGRTPRAQSSSHIFIDLCLRVSNVTIRLHPDADWNLCSPGPIILSTLNGAMRISSIKCQDWCFNGRGWLHNMKDTYYYFYNQNFFFGTLGRHDIVVCQHPSRFVYRKMFKACSDRNSLSSYH